MNLPNKLTLLRIIIAPFFMYFFLLDSFYWRLLSLGLFIVAALTDMIDGYYARKFGIITGFGRFMDPLADKILVSSALISFIALGYVSPLPVMLIIGREFLITGLRLLAAYSSVVIPPTWWAKVKTFIQISLVGVVLLYINFVKSLEYFDSPVLEFFSFDYRYYFNLMLWLTAAITVGTGIDYIVKYSYMIKKALK
ncbi:MAG: CDP-diacylglycerol--glycerol-3-phosphate 3-phosphatidyltransferase [candidate division Zixibacteria bacterium]|nr:CDP-diacylglycerol--glycerol-3-phosphate 3-phosphatidyltransferase [candidate division Zixibacteria bacterium]